MAQTSAQRRANQRAQRDIARRVKEHRTSGLPYRTVLPKSITAPSRKAAIEYGNYMLAHPNELPPKGSLEGKQLARLASWARHGKADPRFEAAFSMYWYHDDKLPDLADDEEEE